MLCLEPDRFKKKLIKNLSYGDYIGIIFKCIVSPRLIFHFIDSKKLDKPVVYNNSIINSLLAVIAIDVKYQGLGLGSKLIEYAERYFLSNNILTYKVDTKINNENAKRFYINHGFVEHEVRGNNILFIKEIV